MLVVEGSLVVDGSTGAGGAEVVVTAAGAAVAAQRDVVVYSPRVYMPRPNRDLRAYLFCLRGSRAYLSFYYTYIMHATGSRMVEKIYYYCNNNNRSCLLAREAILYVRRAVQHAAA